MSFEATPRELGARLRELRTRRGLSLRQAADLFAIPHATLWRWERGEGLGAAALCVGLLEALDEPCSENETRRE